MTKYKILAFLEKEKNHVISGTEIAQKMGVSRNAVWKAIHALKQEGYSIASIKNGGYCYSPDQKADILSAYEIGRRLQPPSLGKQIKVVSVLNSTNTEMKRLAPEQKDGFVLVSERQTGGRGTMRRTFLSDYPEGAYFSLLKKPELLYAQQLPLLTVAASLAVAECLEEDFGIQADVKWPNDIYAEGKKICGILTEASVEQESGTVEWVIVGIGVNVHQKRFPEELSDKAISIKMLTGADGCRAAVIAGILNRFADCYAEETETVAMLERYRKRLAFLGTKKRIRSNGTVYEGILRGIDPEGRLLLELPDQSVVTIASGKLEDI